ncbi:hypothetical protein F3J27_03515 [Enterobacter sp. Ap-916]|uniref:hypothetical protein n=1 Tax=unclassified Enterobacter TaxID=2608935 RepID=UPI0014234731|nr:MULTISPECIES: hypothetical protein [unclassified Enterobacter]NIF57504.1 hypothetical protein [Enterobacter sp. Ap-867]NIG28553.1 hypothetical protein [Enterobacter sp. Ap-916]
MTIDRVLSIIATTVSFIAVPASGFISYRYAILGERRKEFNAIADDIRHKLREHQRHLEQNIYPSGSYIEISDKDFDSLVDVSYAKDRKAIRALCDKYQESLSSSIRFKENGDYEVFGFDGALSALVKLLPLVQRK